MKVGQYLDLWKFVEVLTRAMKIEEKNLTSTMAVTFHSPNLKSWHYIHLCDSSEFNVEWKHVWEIFKKKYIHKIISYISSILSWINSPCYFYCIGYSSGYMSAYWNIWWGWRHKGNGIHRQGVRWSVPYWTASCFTTCSSVCSRRTHT